MFIDKASPSDWESIRKICCLTGNNGKPIDPARFLIFGEIWTGPYQKLYPQWAYVARLSGAIVGYLTGCPDTISFNRRKFVQFDLPLIKEMIKEILLRRYPANSDTKRFIRRTLHLDRGPEGQFPSEIRKRLAREYPAHLHINLDERARGTGIGRQLVMRFFEDLKRENVRGVHVFCGPDPRPFYKKLGFKDITMIEFRPGVWVYAMGIRL